MKKILDFKENKILYFFGLVTVVFFGMFFKMNYSVDTYLLFASRNLEYIREYINSGRFITAFLFKVLQLLKFTPEAMYITSFLIGILCTTFAIYILYSVLKKYIKSDAINAVISIALIINPFIIELWLFIEMGIMMLSILACVLAYKHFDEYLRSNQKKDFIISTLYMLLAVFSYQGTIAIFIALSTISILINNKDIKQIEKNTIKSFVCYGLPTILNFIIIILIGNNRVGIKHDFIQTIKFILVATKEQLFTGYGLYKAEQFVLLYVCALAIALFYIIKSEEKTKNILKFIYLVFITYIFTVATIIPQNIETVVMFPRNTYAYGSIIGLVFLFLIVCLDNKESKVKNKLIIIFILVLLTIEFIQFTIIGINRYVVNYIDKSIILEINNKIARYEQETGNKITNVAIYNLEKSKKFYDGINDNINISAKNEEMSGKALMEFFMHRQLENIEESMEIYNKYFKDNNWDKFNLDQVVLEGNTMHWYLY